MGEILNMNNKKYPLFNEELRDKIGEGIKEHTPDPQKTVTRVEEVLCTHMILKSRDLGEKLANFLFNKITKS